ncbi:hypothetical protein HR11_01465 [Porphyromonas macacae]|nr:hypothetical protein HR11_01465 [Porphyromonas macacae]
MGDYVANKGIVSVCRKNYSSGYCSGFSPDSLTEPKGSYSKSSAKIRFFNCFIVFLIFYNSHYQKDEYSFVDQFVEELHRSVRSCIDCNGLTYENEICPDYQSFMLSRTASQVNPYK